MKSAPHSKLSDARLKALLQGLKEDVAAPADFRGQVLERLRREGVIQSPQASVRAASWWSGWRLPVWRLAAGGGLAAALLIGLWPTGGKAPAPEAAPRTSKAVAVVPATQAHSAPLASHRHPQGPELGATRPAVLAARPATPSIPSGVHPVESRRLAEITGSAVSAGVGAPAQAVAASTRTSPSVVSFGPSDKPTGEGSPEAPTAVPGLGGANSQVRSNVIHASRGESAEILFNLGTAGFVNVEVYDRLGRPVAQLANGTMGAGLQTLTWSGTADEGGMAASGIYIVRVQTPGYVETHKVALIK